MRKGQRFEKGGALMERIIIIPAFRPDKYLKQIVRRNWELENQMIVVDDGSGQEYRPLFEELGEKCIVLHHEENRGKGGGHKNRSPIY